MHNFDRLHLLRHHKNFMVFLLPRCRLWAVCCRTGPDEWHMELIDPQGTEGYTAGTYRKEELERMVRVMDRMNT